MRRDNCLLVKHVIEDCLKKLLIERDVDGAKQLIRSTVSDLLQNKVVGSCLLRHRNDSSMRTRSFIRSQIDLSMLVITKQMSKSASEYQARAAHIELAAKMRKRDAATAPAVGDRIPYVIIQSSKGSVGVLMIQRMR